MDSFRITYRQNRGEPIKARIIVAESLSKATEQMQPMPWSIVRVSMQCRARTKRAGLRNDTHRCGNWSSSAYCSKHASLAGEGPQAATSSPNPSSDAEVAR